jgi:integrase
VKGYIASYQTKAGKRWRFTYELPPTVDPATGEAKRRQATRRGFARERDAQRALREILTDVEDGTHVRADALTVAAFLTDEWLPSIRARTAEDARRHRGTVSPATWDAYRGDLERYVIPRIGGVRLQALTPAHLDDLYDELERCGKRDGTPLSSKTVANVAGIVHRALSFAVKRGRIKRNPADAVSPPVAQKARTSWWSVDQLRAFLRHVKDDELYAAWLLFATTGARLGEVAGLTWDDLDLEDGWMRVDWTLGHVGHKLTWKPRPKSQAGERTMALDPATMTALREHRRRQLETRMLAGPAWQNSFTDWQGRSHGPGSCGPMATDHRSIRRRSATGSSSTRRRPRSPGSGCMTSATPTRAPRCRRQPAGTR